MTDVFIGIDVGTQGTKAIAYLPAASSSTSPSSTSSPSFSSNSSSSSSIGINNNQEKHQHGRILARASATYSLLPNDDNIAGRAEQDPNDWIVAVRSVLRTLVTDLGLVPPSSPSSSSPSSKYVLSGIGISGQQHGMVLLDSDHRPLRPAKLWCDVEACRESEWIRNAFTTGAAAGKETRRWDHVLPGFTSPKVLWTIRNEPEIWNRVRWCCLPHDYVNLVLRGVHDDDDYAREHSNTIVPTTDRGDASGSGVFDPTANRYCTELANAIDPSGRYAKSLPTILDPLDICGNLSFQWMKDVGLINGDSRSPSHDNATSSSTSSSSLPTIPISAGSGDNMCSALGVGCVKPGTSAVLSLGTSGTIFGVSDSPPSSTTVAPFADACGNYLPLACVMSCTGVLESVLDSFFDHGEGSSCEENDDEKWTHEEATKMASCHPPGCYGITFLPYLTPGERTPDWPHASGAILGLTASIMSLASKCKRPTGESTPLDNVDGANTPPRRPANPMAGLLYRAAMEGIAYLLAEAISTMRRACGNDDDGFRPDRLLVVGGGSRNALWRQMLADVSRTELRFPKESDSAALGGRVSGGGGGSRMSSDGAITRGGGRLTMEEYVLEQKVEMEDEIVVPTLDEDTILLYREGRERYLGHATKLFGNEMT